MGCKYCTLQDGECAYPYYGVAPHVGFHIPNDITSGINFLPSGYYPKNFKPDLDVDGKCGTYTHCLHCGSYSKEV
ncbi:hypothetical protein DM558_00290 [Entomomonas moraniae]|uniref:Uncharacterized protein n=1 Tax=Entomomonas moraniae TaxID=2213226 RepID=A0A3S9XAF5_9GAMM|nr:hypothetical protein [Entomomonas moraniae]AZS49308.1 hypothetical protein DM558_00290 [Entomomonas moraniae]